MDKGIPTLHSLQFTVLRGQTEGRKQKEEVWVLGAILPPGK